MKRVVILFLMAIIFLTQSPGFAQGFEYVNSIIWTGLNDIKVRDNYAYCAFRNGLAIIDISSPENPTIISQLYNDGGNGMAIAIEGNYAFLADNRRGLLIFDISDPHNPSMMSQINTGSIEVVEVLGNLALTATNLESPDGGAFRVDIVDISNIETPVEIGQFTSQGDAESIKIIGDYAYVALYYDGVLILDIADPSMPDSVGFIETPGVSANIFIDGSYLYVADGSSGLAIYDISDPLDPILRGVGSGAAYFSHVEVDGIYAYVAAGSIVGGLLIFNVSDPDNPVQAGYYDTPFQGANVVAYANGLCYTITSYFSLDIIDVSQPSNPYSRGELVTPWQVYDVFIVNDLAYVATEQEGIPIFDISDPEDPQLIGNAPSIVGRSICVIGDYAYVLTPSQLLILDISIPQSPLLLSSYWLSTETHDLYVSGSYAYICTDYSGLKIIDISDPENPTEAGSINAPGPSYAVRVVNDIAYIACGPNGLKLYDVSDPSSPQLLSSYSDDIRSMTGVEIQGNYAYVAESMHKLIVLDISHSDNPVLMGENSECGPRGAMLVDNDRIYVEHWLNGLFALDISDPTSPHVIGSYQTPGATLNLAKYQDYIYDADIYSLMIFHETPTGIEEISRIPTGFTLASNYPNPFNASTTISYTLPQPSQVTLDIYDILGRKVQALRQGHQSAGDHSIIFLDKDMPSGIYFYKLTAGEYSQTRKMTLLK